MTHPFVEIQQQIMALLPVILLAPALVLAGGGLLIWLGGIRWMRLIAAIVGALLGLLCAWLWTDRSLIPMVICAVVVFGLSLLLYKFMIVLLAGLLAAGLVLFVPAGLHALRDIEPVRNRSDQRPQSLDFSQSLTRVEEYVSSGAQGTLDYLRAVPSGQKSIALMVGLGVIGAGLFSWRLVCAAGCSMLGCILLASGMMLLLFYKGSDPLSLLKQKTALVGGVLIAMLIFGTLVQYWLCPKKKKKQDAAQTVPQGGNK
ncbi:MAG: hypothetical protein LLF76_13400 [Planctomycetaceae bacterium]|nr:hypothetical protein [Planctomycetaceae bacterium]